MVIILMRVGNEFLVDSAVLTSKGFDTPRPFAIEPEK